MKTRIALLLLGIMCVSNCGVAQEKPSVKVFFAYDESAPSSRDVVHSLRQKMNDSHMFEIVGKNDPNLVLIVDCAPRATPSDEYVCLYIGHYAGTAFKTLLGSTLWTGKTADEVATAFLSGVAADIVERWNETIRDNHIEALEACLHLTESSCAVPDDLQTELKVKSINLSQYLRKGSLKK